MAKSPAISGMDDLPGFLKEVARLTCVKAALQLAYTFGGFNRVYVPMNPRSNSPITRCIGLDHARALAREYGGTHQEIPRFTGPVKKPKIAVAQGSNVEIARRFGVTVRYVRMVKNGCKKDPRQGLLFTED